jgi:hypothetical protein
VTKTNSQDLALLGLPIMVAIFCTILVYGSTTLIFITVASLVVAGAVVIVVNAIGGLEISILGTGYTLPDPGDWGLRFMFIIAFLPIFYASNVATGLNLILGFPYGIGVLLIGVLSTMFVLGLFSITSGS